MASKGRTINSNSKNSRNPALRNPHTNSTVGLGRAKATPNVHKPRLHAQMNQSMRTAGSRTSSRLSADSPDAVNTVGLKGAKVPSNKGTTSNLSKTSPRAINSQGITKATKRAPLQSKQSAGTGKIYTGRGTKTPFVGNRKVVQTSVPGAGTIPAVVRRAASRSPEQGSSKPSFTTRIAKILSK